jgi:hypothetical protein
VSSKHQSVKVKKQNKKPFVLIAILLLIIFIIGGLCGRRKGYYPKPKIRLTVTQSYYPFPDNFAFAN